MEATDCRRAFPCWDEPALKATFDISLRVKTHLTALSNMNVISESEITVDSQPLKEFKFATTPIMSTYLVAMAVGEFEYIETVAKPKAPADAKPITIRVYTTPGKVEQGRFALNVSARVLEFFSEYFNIAYPLPKLDSIAIPDFSAGAMENWGLVTYREIYLLFDEKTSSARAKQGIAYVVAHEEAHQWFGNLVTMEWWKELWLNEGFATSIGWLATDELFPEWDIWTQFIIDDFQRGLTLDSLRSSHPIEVEVKRPSEITQIFDAISYSKGASVMRMLADFLGRETFMNGIRTYLKAFSYRNAVTTDLWEHLSASSKVDITAMMRSWTGEMGYPLIEILEEKYDSDKKTMTLKLRQRRYLSSGDVKPEDDKVLWWIPLSVITHSTSKSVQHVFSTKESTFTFPYAVEAGKEDEAFWKLNVGVTGFFRVKYEEGTLARLGRNITKLQTSDRIGLITDAFALALSGEGSTVGALELLKALEAEEQYIVLSEINSRLSNLVSVWYKQPKDVLEGLSTLTRQIFAPKVVKMGYEYPEKEDYLTTLKRTLAISQAAKSGDAGVIAELSKRFEKYVAGDQSALHPNLRGVAFGSVLRNVAAGEPAQKAYEAVLKIYKETQVVDQKLIALGALGHCPHEEQILQTLQLSINPDLVRPQDIMYPLSTLVRDNTNSAFIRPYMIGWFKQHWQTFYDRYHSSLSLLGRTLSISVENSVGEDVVKDIESWVSASGESDEKKAEREKQLKGIDRSIQQCLEKVRGNTKWVERDAEGVAQWVRKNFPVGK